MSLDYYAGYKGTRLVDFAIVYNDKESFNKLISDLILVVGEPPMFSELSPIEYNSGVLRIEMAYTKRTRVSINYAVSHLSWIESPANYESISKEQFLLAMKNSKSMGKPECNTFKEVIF
jgi:hypothetical protein